MQQTQAVDVAPVILVAEDDDMFRELLCGVLRRAGYQVLEARTGERVEYVVRAMTSADGTRPGLVISDIRMPGLSGLALLEAMRRMNADTPVILMTGFGSLEVETEARELGAITVLSKPFELEDLLAHVRELVPIAAKFAV